MALVLPFDNTQMIEETVQVIAVEENILTLQAQRKSTCHSCSAQKGCGTSVLAKWLGNKSALFHTQNTIQAQIGDSIVVGISEDGLLKGSVLIYFIPLLSLILSAMAVDLVIPISQFSDLWVAISGMAGLFAGILLSRLILSRLAVETLNPVILRKNIGHGKLSV